MNFPPQLNSLSPFLPTRRCIKQGKGAVGLGVEHAVQLEVMHVMTGNQGRINLIFLKYLLRNRVKKVLKRCTMQAAAHVQALRN